MNSIKPIKQNTISYEELTGRTVKEDLDYKLPTKIREQNQRKSADEIFDKIVLNKINLRTKFKENSQSYYLTTETVFEFCFDKCSTKKLVEHKDWLKENISHPIIETCFLNCFRMVRTKQGKTKGEILKECGINVNLFSNETHECTGSLDSFNKNVIQLTSNKENIDFLKKIGVDPLKKPEKTQQEIILSVLDEIKFHGSETLLKSERISERFLSFIQYEAYILHKKNKPSWNEGNPTNEIYDYSILKAFHQMVKNNPEKNYRGAIETEKLNCIECAKKNKDFKKLKMIKETYNIFSEEEEESLYKKIQDSISQKDIKKAIKLSRIAISLDNEELYKNLENNLDIFQIPEKNGTYKNLLLCCVDLNNKRYAEKIIELNEKHLFIDKEKTNTSEKTYIGYCIGKGKGKFGQLFLENNYFSETEKLPSVGHERNNLDRALRTGLSTLAFMLYEKGFSFDSTNPNALKIIKKEKEAIKNQIKNQKVEDKEEILNLNKNKIKLL